MLLPVCPFKDKWLFNNPFRANEALGTITISALARYRTSQLGRQTQAREVWEVDRECGRSIRKHSEQKRDWKPKEEVGKGLPWQCLPRLSSLLAWQP